MSKKLTIKQRKWLDLYIETGNATESARQTYVCKNDAVARVIGCENLTKLNIPVAKMMDRKGLTGARLIKNLSEGLNANRVVVDKYQGRIRAERYYPDFPMRKGYLEIALKLKGHLRQRVTLRMKEQVKRRGRSEDAEVYVRKFLAQRIR